jgi:hypothetical protein
MKYQSIIKSGHDGYNWLVRLNKGDLLVSSLIEFAREQQIRGAWVSGVGGALWAELGFYDLEQKQYHWQKLDQPLEITSLQGNLTLTANGPALHIHGTFSDKNMQAFGGHVKELAVAGTCEILLHRWYKDALTRSFDDEVGLQLLDL